MDGNVPAITFVVDVDVEQLVLFDVKFTFSNGWVGEHFLFAHHSNKVYQKFVRLELSLL